MVIQHISNFPREVSHYGRMKSNREYLSQDLNINRLYRSFKGIYPNTDITYRFYYTTFKNKYPNLKFHHPRTDTCQTCDLLNMQRRSNPNDRDVKTKLEVHHRKVEKAMKIMKEDHAKSQLPLTLSTPAITYVYLVFVSFLF